MKNKSKDGEEVDTLAPYTCGYILPSGKLYELNEYHGEDETYRHKGYPEYSNTHPEEDTCVRIFIEPNAEQYAQLETVIDKYLDQEFYCKVEVWSSYNQYEFYNTYSLYEKACPDYEEIVGKWTGYKLVQIIKQYFKNIKKEEK